MHDGRETIDQVVADLLRIKETNGGNGNMSVQIPDIIKGDGYSSNHIKTIREFTDTKGKKFVYIG